MAVNPEKNGVNQGFITKLIGIVKRKVLDLSGAVSDEETRAMAAEASARTEVVQGENCTIEKTTASDGHDVYTINADGKPQVQADWSQADSSKVDYIKNKPDLSLKEDVANKSQSIDPTSTTEYGSSKAVADFVNSSVATNTANFLGSFTLNDLSLTYPATDVQIAAALNSHTWPTGVTPTNNDYVYVEIQDPQTTGIDDKVERFKFSDMLESWGYEYTLNNSSFTAAEMATLESGITASDKTTWNNHVGNTSNPHNVTAAQVGAEPAFSVLPIAKGGTGQTSLADVTVGNATNANKVNNHTVGTDVPDDAKFIEYVTAENTFDEIKAIVNAGHEPVLKVESSSGGVSHKLRLPLVYFETGTMSAQVAMFSGTHGDKIYTYMLMAGSWSTETTTVPAAQVNSDWDATTGVAAISNKPTFANVADATTTIDSNTPIVVGYDSTAKKLKTRLVSALMSFLGISVSGNAKSFSGKSALAADADHAAIADTLNYDTIASGNAYVPVFDHNGKRLKVVAGLNGLILQKAADADIALLNCKSALAADADHAASADASYYAQRIGTAESHPNVGSPYKAVHVNQSGVVTECAGYFVAGKDSNGNDARYTIVVGATGTDQNTIYFS